MPRCSATDAKRRVDSEGIEPSSLPCEDSIVPLDHEPGSERGSGLDENRTRLMLIDSEPTSPDVSEARKRRRDERRVSLVVEPEGVAPSSLICRNSILLLNYGPKVS